MTAQHNATIVQGIYAAFGQGDIPAILSTLADDVTFYQPPGGAPPLTGTYHGRDGAATFFQRLVEAVDVLMFEPQEIVAQGDTVVALGRYRFRARATGITYDTDWAMVWRFRAGKIATFQAHVDSATEAAALRGT
jgi:ketosteroid isomerase-like protein